MSLTTMLSALLALLACVADALGPAPGGPGLTLAIAALVASYRTTGTLSSLLAFVALGVALSDNSPLLLTPLEWMAHLALALAMGALARHSDGPVARACHDAPLRVAGGLSALGVLLALLPDRLTQLMDAHGVPLELSVAVSEPLAATQLAVSVPARLELAWPLMSVSQWTVWVAILSGICVILATLLRTPRSRQVALGALTALMACLVAPALADLAQLLGGGPVPLPSAEALIVELGWTSGGATGLELHAPPEEGYLTMASRPVVSVLRLALGLALAAWLLTALRGGASLPEGRALSMAWVWAACACALVSMVGFMAYVSAERLDIIAQWGASPVAYSVAGGALIAFAAGVAALFDARAAGWSVVAELLALILWCGGLLAPNSGGLVR